MTCDLYSTKSENNVLSKTLNEIKKNIAVKLKNDTSIIKPTFILSNDNINFKELNYLYCVDFGRYYYIDNITLLNGNLIALECHVDVLMSFANDIKNASVLVLNSETETNNYLPSNIWRNDVRETTEILNFQSGFNNEPQFILITAGATI